MERIKISDLEVKQEASSVFLVKYIAIMEAKDGKKYINLVLSDNSGDIESRIWNNAEQVITRIEKGSFVEVKGKVNLFQGRKQFIVNQIDKVNESEIDRDDFVVRSEFGADEMFTELLEIVHSLDDVYIRDLLKNVLNDPEIARRLKKWQAGKTIHHAYESGLLEHILSCSKLAIHLSEFYKANKNYVVCGAILHDLCKIYELTDDINVEYTEEGKLVGHLVKGLEIVDRFSYRIENFPYQMKLHIKHILLSHHGEYEYGSPKIPQTVEAMLVHLIDHMDSKIHSFRTIQKNDPNTGHWSNYIKHLDRLVFKAELPFFPEYITDNKKDSYKKKKPASSELKQSLGSALKDFKVDS